MFRKLGCMLFLSSLLANAGDRPATGTMAWTCIPSLGARIILDGPDSFQLFYDKGRGYPLVPHEQIPMRLFSCLAPTCFDLGMATVVFDQIDSKGASGSYALDDNTKKGSFKVVAVKQSSSLHCQ